MLENSLEKIIPYYLFGYYVYMLLYSLTIICFIIIWDTIIANCYMITMKRACMFPYYMVAIRFVEWSKDTVASPLSSLIEISNSS